MFDTWTGKQIRYPDMAKKLFPGTPLQEIIPFVGAGVSVSARTPEDESITPRFPSKEVLEQISLLLGISGEKSLLYLEYALRSALSMQALEQARGPAPTVEEFLQGLKKAVYPPFAWELAEMFSLLAPYRAIDDTAGRRLNDTMGLYVAVEVVKLMAARRIHIKGARVLVLGLTFKENCPDIRNSKVVDLIRELEKYGALVHVYDPWVKPAVARHEYGIKSIRTLRRGTYDAAILAVGHNEFKAMGAAAIRQLCRRNHVLYDIKYAFPASQVDGRI